MSLNRFTVVAMFKENATFKKYLNAAIIEAAP